MAARGSKNRQIVPGYKPLSGKSNLVIHEQVRTSAVQQQDDTHENHALPCLQPACVDVVIWAGGWGATLTRPSSAEQAMHVVSARCLSHVAL